VIWPSCYLEAFYNSPLVILYIQSSLKDGAQTVLKVPVGSRAATVHTSTSSGIGVVWTHRLLIPLQEAYQPVDWARRFSRRYCHILNPIPNASPSTEHTIETMIPIREALLRLLLLSFVSPGGLDVGELNGSVADDLAPELSDRWLFGVDTAVRIEAVERSKTRLVSDPFSSRRPAYAEQSQ
jgi:hypothetical protein